MTRLAVPGDPEFQTLCAAVLETLGLRLDAYRPTQLERRLAFFRQRHGLRSNAELAARIRVDRDLRDRLASFLTINVSEFFRNPDRFAELRDRFLPALLARKPALRVWSAGCSIGAELYSVALFLRELAPGKDHELLGTDIDPDALWRARAGIYETAELRAVPERLLRAYFRPVEGRWELSPAVRTAVRFARHDLLRDPYPRGWDLILCRNVVIYFTDDAKAEVWRQLAASLNDGGILFVGGSESLYGVQNTGLRYVAPCFYVKK
ncbi:MAG TPA: protein-glutamate O-methyltransferase CheR [Thermaerobacter sp.]